jgi:hypothetical protein
MSYDIELCNDKGMSLCGSDGHFNIDKRFGLTRVRMEVREYRERFKKNFSHKYEHWTHFRFHGRIYTINY